MFVGCADHHAGDVYRFFNIQTKKVILSRDVKWLNLFWKHHKMRHNNPRRQQVVLFLDEEENLSLERNDPEENSIEGDGNNTIEQRKLGLDIDMIGPEKMYWEGQEVRHKNCFHAEMNPWKEQI